MSTFEKVYEGKAKSIYRLDDDAQVVQRFKDTATAFNGVKFAVIDGKGELNNRISSAAFRFLAARGIDSHYIDTLNTRDMLIQSVNIIPLEVVVRNVAAGSLSKRTGLEEGTPLARPIVETYYKRDDLGDPILAPCHIRMLDIATDDEVATLEAHARAVNQALLVFWGACELTLVDFKLEYGRTPDGRILLADEISPDTSRLWDAKTNAKMDKDVFRRDLADLRETYQAVHDRLRDAHPDAVLGELAVAPATS
ncbi:MAG: phosphoribosylaminoimidazole-succinocarboxamide synthase [Bradymonadia bacterium]|jgi:phosphoribosylaminoimidazole-succinocarboxamide synthase